jgi:hypothetical protein
VTANCKNFKPNEINGPKIAYCTFLQPVCKKLRTFLQPVQNFLHRRKSTKKKLLPYEANPNIAKKISIRDLSGWRALPEWRVVNHGPGKRLKIDWCFPAREGQPLTYWGTGSLASGPVMWYTRPEMAGLNPLILLGLY